MYLHLDKTKKTKYNLKNNSNNWYNLVLKIGNNNG